MSYQVVKGWPSDGAIDEIFAPATGVTLVGGSIAAIDAAGNLVAANYNTNGSDAGNQAVFVIDVDTVKGTCTALMGKHLVEVDADHYESGVYTPNTLLTASGGKFDIIGAVDDDRPVVGKVRSVDAATGKIRVLFGFGPDAVQASAPSVGLTESGAVEPGAMAVELNHATVVIAATIADATDHQGLFIVKNTSASGTAAHTLTLTAGTFDGTNNRATLNAPNKALVVWFDSAGNGTIIENVDTVALSEV